MLLYTDVMARGGDASSASGQGGNGGGIYLGTDNDYGVLNGDARAVFDGDAQLSGGDGGNSGGEGGQLYSDSFNDGLIDGTIDASGGDATSAASYGYGGEGGVLHAVSVFGGMEFAGSFLAPGGDGANGAGGDGGEGLIYGGFATCPAAIDLSGGDGDATGGEGGDGGRLTVFGTTATDATGAFTTSGGAGATAGQPGTVTVDGIPR